MAVHATTRDVAILLIFPFTVRAGGKWKSGEVQPFVGWLGGGLKSWAHLSGLLFYVPL